MNSSVNNPETSGTQIKHSLIMINGLIYKALNSSCDIKIPTKTKIDIKDHLLWSSGIIKVLPMKFGDIIQNGSLTYKLDLSAFMMNFDSYNKKIQSSKEQNSADTAFKMAA